MAGTIPNFHIESAKVQLGPLARTNLFLFEIPALPSKVRGDIKDIMFGCESAQVPGVTNEVQKVPWMNSEYKIPGNSTYEDFRVGIRVAEHLRILDILDSWYKVIYDPSTGIQGVPADCWVSARVSLLNYQGVIKKVWTLHDMWPSAIEAIELNREGSDKMVVNVTFTYNWHEITVGGRNS